LAEAFLDELRCDTVGLHEEPVVLVEVAEGQFDQVDVVVGVFGAPVDRDVRAMHGHAP
jgi:hypothetical protein